MKSYKYTSYLIKNIVLAIFCICCSTVKSQLVNLEKADSISILFEFGSSKVDKDKQTLLIERLNKIQFGQSAGKIIIKAYTDTVGSVNFNKILASKRLNEVARVIGKSNLKTFILDSLNLNETSYSRTFKDEEKRRVDIIVYKATSNFKLKIPIVLNIAFQGDKAELIGEDKNEDLAELMRIMKSDHAITIKLNGHVAVRPDQQLSLNRALRIKKYLLKEGIEEKRMSCEGFSNTKPLIPNATTEEQYAQNRRVEVVFIK